LLKGRDKMIKIEAQALVTYTCVLTEEDEKIVLDYAKENDISVEEAIKKLWENCDIDIYAGSQTESDCQTQEVILLEQEND
jgi:hypothetical protein